MTYFRNLSEFYSLSSPQSDIFTGVTSSREATRNIMNTYFAFESFSELILTQNISFRSHYIILSSVAVWSVGICYLKETNTNLRKNSGCPTFFPCSVLFMKASQN